MPTNIIPLILSLSFLALTSSKLQVNNFAEMDKSLQDKDLKDIPYSIANFGFAPFGKTIIAPLQLTPGLNDQCSLNQSVDITKQIQNSFLLIPRGQCPFVTKAIHAQQMGAKMAIIMDNDQHQRGIIMKDNGYGYKVKIPSIFINHELGTKLSQLFNKTKKVVLKIQFQNKKTQKVDIILFLQSMKRQSYYFIQQFQPFYQQIKSQINFQIVYDVINCNRCNNQDCYFNGKYCYINFQHQNSAIGSMILDQQIRQQVMFNKFNDKWWGYMKCINDECSRISQIQQCSKTCVKKVGVSLQTFATQVKQTFNSSDDNTVLQQHFNTLKNSGVEQFPSIIINNIRMRGSLNAQFVFDDICNTLIKPPQACSGYVNISHENITTSHPINWGLIIFLLILCAAIFISLFIFCRRQIKKKMTQEMQGRVDDMVSKYIQFYSERNNRK